MYNLQGRRKWLLWLLGGILLCGMLSFLYKTEYSNSTGKVLNIYGRTWQGCRQSLAIWGNEYGYFRPLSTSL